MLENIVISWKDYVQKARMLTGKKTKNSPAADEGDVNNVKIRKKWGRRVLFWLNRKRDVAEEINNLKSRDRRRAPFVLFSSVPSSSARLLPLLLLLWSSNSWSVWRHYHGPRERGLVRLSQSDLVTQAVAKQDDPPPSEHVRGALTGTKGLNHKYDL